MNKIELPEPKYPAAKADTDTPNAIPNLYTAGQVIAAIEADRKRFAELFMDLSRYAAGMYERDDDPLMAGVSDGYWYAAECLLGNKDAVKELGADRQARVCECKRMTMAVINVESEL